MTDPLSRKHGTAAFQETLRGRVRVRPRLCLDALGLDGICGTQTSAKLAVMDLQSLIASVVVPVKITAPGCHLEQTVVPGWARYITVPEEETSLLFAPVVISSRDAWLSSESGLEIFDRAHVLDGAIRLEAAARRQAPARVPVMVVFGLDAARELKIRQSIVAAQGSNPVDPDIPRVDSASPRLEVKDRWIAIRIESDPFVVPTARGYAPAVLIRRPGQRQREHLLIGAMSLAKPLEKLRQKFETLQGVKVRIRKSESVQTAPYEVELDD